jgi:DNA-directed RNA polymerase subunit RPC12/RpoP
MGTIEAKIMAPDPAAAAAETPCPNCGSKRATTTPGEELEFECRDCGEEFDRPGWG